MKLSLKSLLLQPIPDGINPVRHHQRWAFVPLGQKVAQWPIQRSGQTHDFPVLGDESKGAIDFPDRFRRALQDAGTGFLQSHVKNAIGRGIGEINQPFEVLVCHGGVMILFDRRFRKTAKRFSEAR